MLYKIQPILSVRERKNHKENRSMFKHVYRLFKCKALSQQTLTNMLPNFNMGLCNLGTYNQNSVESK